MDDRLDVRQRRAIATSNSYPDDTEDDSVSPIRTSFWYSPFPTLTSRWNSQRNSGSKTIRITMKLIETALTAFAIFLFPTGIQYVVRWTDELHEIVGRRARSPFESVSWARILGGMVVLVVWHVVLVGLSYAVLAGGNGDERVVKEKVEDRIKDPLASSQNKTSISLGRIISRILLPGYLLLAILFFTYSLASRLIYPTFATPNTDSALEGT